MEFLRWRIQENKVRVGEGHARLHVPVIERDAELAGIEVARGDGARVPDPVCEHHRYGLPQPRRRLSFRVAIIIYAITVVFFFLVKAAHPLKIRRRRLLVLLGRWLSIVAYLYRFRDPPN